jgi:class 3 adenylate cyclase
MPTDAESHRKLAAILSADVVGYSRLMEADEQATVDTLKSSRATIRGHIERHRGRVVNAPGCRLAEFPSAVEAVQCAFGKSSRILRNAMPPTAMSAACTTASASTSVM